MDSQSLEAYGRTLPSMAESRKACLELIAEAPRTAKECARLLGKPFNAVSGRLPELKNLGLVVKTGEIRDDSSVLRVA